MSRPKFGPTRYPAYRLIHWAGIGLGMLSPAPNRTHLGRAEIRAEMEAKPDPAEAFEGRSGNCALGSDGQSPGFGSVLSVKRLDFKHFTVLKRSANPVIAQYCSESSASLSLMNCKGPFVQARPLKAPGMNCSNSMLRMTKYVNFPSSNVSTD